MQTMDQDLMRLLKAGRISAEDAYLKARSKKDFEESLHPDSVIGAGDSSDKTNAPAGGQAREVVQES